MPDKKELIKRDEIEKITVNRITDALTGFLSAKKDDYAYSANRLFKSIFAKNFLFQLQMEFDLYCQKGKIDTDYIGSKPYLNSLSELLDYLDSDIPNDEIAQTLKKLFLIPAFKDLYGNKKLLAYEYMKIVKMLTSGELSVLFAAYKIAGGKTIVKEVNHGRPGIIWRETIAKESSLDFVELVEVHEKKLILMLLILDEANFFNKYTGKPECTNRLTDLGYALCDYIDKYDLLNA